MADHYDTAYMEDVFYPESGGDALRAPACGADDNHSATSALLLAAEQLLALSRAGKLARDVWLVHLTGEEFPGDCLGARALAQSLVEGQLTLQAEGGRALDVSRVRVVGAFVLDMIGHNTDRDRDVFQIAPGEGAASARLARRAHLANLCWNRIAGRLNQAPDRKHAGRPADGAAVAAELSEFLSSRTHAVRRDSRRWRLKSRATSVVAALILVSYLSWRFNPH